MYLDKIMWLLAWPAMIALSYYLTLWAIKLFDEQMKNDPLGEDLYP
ncbi:MAG: hypothetical protein V1775_02120 [Bacteroidota bacterium]